LKKINLRIGLLNVSIMSCTNKEASVTLITHFTEKNIFTYNILRRTQSRHELKYTLYLL